MTDSKEALSRLEAALQEAEQANKAKKIDQDQKVETIGHQLREVQDRLSQLVQELNVVLQTGSLTKKLEAKLSPGHGMKEPGPFVGKYVFTRIQVSDAATQQLYFDKPFIAMDITSSVDHKHFAEDEANLTNAGLLETLSLTEVLDEITDNVRRSITLSDSAQ